MSELRSVRGTRDFFPKDSRHQRRIEEAARAVASAHGFGEISTPILEFTEVFARTLGDTSDIVSKEMYTFEDRSGDRVTMRPENTAGIVRAFISNGMAQALPLKLFYRGPMFRYERPQKGRLRQFHQVGVELLGHSEPYADVEVIGVAADLLERLGLGGQVRIEVNSLGDDESRQAYRDVLVGYLRDHGDRLSADSRERLERNPLRILDSKAEQDRAIVAGAPSIADSLNPLSRDFFGEVWNGLEALGLQPVLNTRLVRGLDYYCHTIFEFTSEALGAQGTVLAGGRYDGLVKQMGGPATPGTGWAAGVERLMMLVAEDEQPPRSIVVIPLGTELVSEAFGVAQRLRRGGHVVEVAYSGGMSRRMKWANRTGARATLFLGPDEVAKGVLGLRDMDSGEQSEIPIDDLENRVRHFL